MTEPKQPVGEVLTFADSPSRIRLRQFLQENSASLLGIIRSYVLRMGLAQGTMVELLAADVLHDTVIEGLAHAERFDPATQPRAWLLAIAVNVLKRKKADQARRYQREVTMSEVSGSEDADFFDQFSALTGPGPEHSFEVNERVNELLALVSHEDREVLSLALLHDLDMRTLAQALNVSPGAARVRLHRALNRLRTAFKKKER